MPKHPEILLSKLDLDKKDSAENHVNKFLLVVRLHNIQYEYIFYRFFLTHLKIELQRGFSLWKKLLSLVGEHLRQFFLRNLGITRRQPLPYLICQELKWTPKRWSMIIINASLPY
jgi:hypothetical protein